MDYWDRLYRTFYDSIPIWTCTKCGNKITGYEIDVYVMTVTGNKSGKLPCPKCRNVDPPFAERTYGLSKQLLNKLGREWSFKNPEEKHTWWTKIRPLWAIGEDSK